MGFFDRVAKGWGFMKQAFAMARDDRSLLRPSLYSVGVGIFYWVGWAVAFVAADLDPDSGGARVLGALAVFGSFAIFYFFMAMTVNMVDVHLSGGTPSVSEGFRDARQNFLAILCLALVSTIVELLAKAARRQGRESGGLGGALGSVVGSLIESLWTVVSFLLLPAIIIEDCSLGQALERVRAISKGNYLQIGVGEVGVRVVSNLIGFAVMLLTFGVLYVGFEVIGHTAGAVLGIALGGTLLCLFAAFSSFLRMAYYTCLYRWAAAAHDGRNEPPPLPLARVLDR
jgi:hypothetical protein